MEETKNNEKNEIVKAQLSQVKIKAKIRELTQKALPGKCTVRFMKRMERLIGKMLWLGNLTILIMTFSKN